MDTVRERTSKRIFISFLRETEWVEFELRFNLGSKKQKPLKFQAWRTWRTPNAPELFGGTRASFASVREAEAYLAAQFHAGGGVVHPHSPSLVSRLRKTHGYNGA